MDAFDRAAVWCRWDALIRNQIKVLNVITGDRVSIALRGGRYRVRFLGRVVAEYPFYDVDAARLAYERLSAVKAALWDCRREGLASFA